MGKSAYTRKTTNPKMDWSEERKAKWSAQCKEAHANKTWYKKSKKAVGLAISNGKKEALKFKNRSEAMKKSWRKRKRLSERNEFNNAIMNHAPTTPSENLLDKAVLPEGEDDSVNQMIHRTNVDAEVASDIKEEEEKVSHNFPEPYETWDKKQTDEFAVHLAMAHTLLYNIDLLFGVKPTLHSFIISAIREKFDRVTETFHAAPDPEEDE